MDHLKQLNQAQKDAVCATEGPVLVLAGAGAGKTRTIAHRVVHLVKGGVAGNKILAITFTNKAAREMRERVLGLLAKHGARGSGRAPTVSTFHALSAQLLRQYADEAKLPKNYVIFDRTDSLRAVKRATREAGEDDKRFEPRAVLSTISRAKGDAKTLSMYREETGNAWFQTIVAEIWARYDAILRKEGALDFDDLLLNTWRLLVNNKEVRETLQHRFHYLHIDEYQDTNKVQYEIARLLTGEQQNIFCVGDLDQCLIKGTLVTMSDKTQKPIEKVCVGEAVLSNYGSGDIRPAQVTAVHRKTLATSLVEITTKKGGVVTSTPEHMHFAGYRLGHVPQTYFTYLMEKRGVGFRLGITCVYTKGQRKPMTGFQQRCNHEHADHVWILATHKNTQDARVLEYTLSLKYKLPTLPFVARKGLSNGGYVHDQKTLDSIFASFDTVAAGTELLHDYGLSPSYPHHRAQATNSTRRNIVVSLCGDHRGKTPMHRISVIGSDKEGARAIRSLGLSVRAAKTGSSGWRFETANKNYEVILQYIASLKNVFPDAHVVHTARLGKNTKQPGKNALPFLPAGSVRVGMAMFDAHGTYDVVTHIRYLPVRKHKVYDLDIAHTHNYIANGLTTHNSVYAWRGASIDNILKFEQTFPRAQVIRLEQNYRSTQTIVAVSNDIIRKNKNRKDKTLFTKNAEGDKMTLLIGYNEQDEAARVVAQVQELLRDGVQPNEIAILYRANFQSRVLEDAFLAENVPYKVLGTRFFDRKEVKDVLAYVRAALNPESESDIGRVINSPTRGIGKVTVDRLLTEGRATLTGRAKEKVDEFFSILSDIREAADTKKASKALALALTRSGIATSLEGKGEEDEERLLNVRELVSLAASRYDEFEAPDGVLRMLEDAALATDQDELDRRNKKDGAVALMTIHAAKGLEFSYVFITGLEDGLFPHERMHTSNNTNADDEEERRLFYVALTRAKKKVYLSYAQMRTVFGQRNTNLPSEFLLDIDEAFLDTGVTPAAETGRVIYLD